MTKYIFTYSRLALALAMYRLLSRPIALDTKADKGDIFELVELAVAKIERN
jgi:hypothetical protein